MYTFTLKLAQEVYGGIMFNLENSRFIWGNSNFDRECEDYFEINLF